MHIFNIIKRTSICLGLLLIHTFVTINYQYADAAKVEKTTKVSEEEKQVVKDMYKAFQKVIKDGVTQKNAKEFYDKYFASNIYQSFGIKKNYKDKFDEALICYFVKLLNQQTLQDQVNGHELSNEFSKISKKKSSVIKCTLKREKQTTDMSVVLTKDKRIKELSFLNNSIQLIKGAKTIVENYCKENKKKEYKKFKKEEKVQICEEAWKQHVNK